MNWFDDQLRERRLRDDELFKQSLRETADTVMGRRSYYAAGSESDMAENALGEILRYYRFAPRDIPDSIEDLEEQIEYALRPYGMMYRRVELEKGWRRNAVGAYLGFLEEDGRPVALIPTWPTGYRCHDPEDGKSTLVTGALEKELARDAYCFYRPFPQKSLTIPDLFRYIISCLRLSDYLLTAGITFVVTLIGLLIPTLTYLLYNDVVQSGSIPVFLSLAVFMVCVSVSQILISAAGDLISGCVSARLSLNIEAAAMVRVLSLPASFFRTFNSGETASRTEAVSSLCSTLADAVFTTGLSSLMSLLYITQIFRFAPALVIPSLVIILSTIVISLLTMLLEMRRQRSLLLENSKCLGLAYALIGGIKKIRLAGAEKRAYSHWAFQYNKTAALQFSPPLLLKLGGVITTAIELIGTIVLYAIAMSAGISSGSYLAFNAAYGTLAGAFGSLASIATVLARIRPVLDMAKPILETAPETDEGKEVLSSLEGSIELHNVSFAYKEGGPLILDNLSLKIRKGEYVAIVGRTGCGKSTLIRLLLGFEKPTQGTIFYNGKNLEKIDVRSLRRQIGTVMQDSGLFQGDIYSNIALSAPSLSMEEAWRAAEIACIADDIREMPMGMQTLLSEGQGSISGGQKQRLMIARAVAPRPSVLIFDEATSALDNISQRKVTQALDGLGCTRIVIAHRLSTIRHCDRILFLGDGKILEEGTYEELMAQNGLFAELVKRQVA